VSEQVKKKKKYYPYKKVPVDKLPENPTYEDLLNNYSLHATNDD